MSLDIDLARSSPLATPMPWPTGPACGGRWNTALHAFDTPTYVNELGAAARAQRLDELHAWCDDFGLTVEQWCGGRVLTDSWSADAVPDPATLDQCLAAEIEAGQRDPYRWFGSQFHVIARRVATDAVRA